MRMYLVYFQETTTKLNFEMSRLFLQYLIKIEKVLLNSFIRCLNKGPLIFLQDIKEMKRKNVNETF